MTFRQKKRNIFFHNYKSLFNLSRPVQSITKTCIGNEKCTRNIVFIVIDNANVTQRSSSFSFLGKGICGGHAFPSSTST